MSDKESGAPANAGRAFAASPSSQQAVSPVPASIPSEDEPLRFIFNGHAADVAEAAALAVRERALFSAEWLKVGCGWGYRLATGRHYFLRRIKGGVSANLSKWPPHG